MAWPRTDCWIWVFAGVDHYTAQAWATWPRSATASPALQPVYDAAIDRWDRLEAEIARGVQLRHDWACETAGATSSARSPGWASPMMLRSWRVGNQRLRESRIRTLREQCVWAELDGTVDQLPPAVSGFVDRYTSWLIQRARPPDPPFGRDNRFIGADANASEGYQASQ